MIARYFKKLDSFFLLLVAIIAFSLTLIDLFNLADHYPWLKTVKDTKYPLLSVAMLSLIGAHLVAVHGGRTDTKEQMEMGLADIKKGIEDETAKLIQTLKGVNAKYFENMTDLENYLAAQLLQAKREVCDLSWKQSISQHYNMRVRQEARQNFETNIKKISETVNYREIFIFNDPRRLEKLKKRLAENVTGYSCRYYSKDSEIPRLQFVIIDDREIIFASSSYPVLCAIQHTELCSIFKAYYDAAWQKAIPIKTGDVINHKLVEKLLKDLHESS